MTVLGEVFYWIFNMSLLGSAMGLIVLAIRAIKAIPRRIAVLLWLVPFGRMAVPLWLNSRLSLMTLISRFTTRTVTVLQPHDDLAFSFTNTVMAANSYFPIIYRVNVLDGVFRVGAVVWAIGAVSLLLALGMVYGATLREVRNARHLRQNIYLSEKVTSPAVYGVIRPRIVIPAAWEGRDLTYILAHENAHIRRCDNLWRLLAFAVTAVHWFNPLAWLFLKLLLGDLELACDERVIASYDDTRRKAYAHALLDSAGDRSLFASAFGGAKVRTRIENVLSFRRMTWLSGVGFAAMIGAILLSLLTNAG